MVKSKKRWGKLETGKARDRENQKQTGSQEVKKHK